MDDVLRRTFDRAIAENRYPGRGLIIGRNELGEWALVYWIMGRSDNSRNRQFVADGGTLRTQAYDARRVVDPSLIIYEAMLELPGVQLVSNGDQTRTIHDALSRGSSFEAALSTRAHEPDAPHYTPRISGMLDLRGAEPRVRLSILRASPADVSSTDRTFFDVALPPHGVGRGLTTYAGDGDPLPTFVGEPLALPLAGGGADILERYWSALDADNRISLAVKTVAADGRGRELRVRNRYS
ncbi:MAG TPA: IMP cyclohydrolase [Polyangiaceae bacterium]|nr:IMP cyclohydrolase [Polyangiaceae bacterium]